MSEISFIIFNFIHLVLRTQTHVWYVLTWVQLTLKCRENNIMNIWIITSSLICKLLETNKFLLFDSSNLWSQFYRTGIQTKSSSLTDSSTPMLGDPRGPLTTYWEPLTYLKPTRTQQHVSSWTRYGCLMQARTLPALG